MNLYQNSIDEFLYEYSEYSECINTQFNCQNQKEECQNKKINLKHSFNFFLNDKYNKEKMWNDCQRNIYPYETT